MIRTLAWRNVWRNPTRSLVVIGAIAMGIWAAIFMSGFATGMMRSYIANSIEDIVSHIQVHHPEFSKDFEARFYIDDLSGKEAQLRANPAIKAYTVRSVVNAMASSSKAARGIQIKGVDPETEPTVTSIREKVTQGTYFEGNRKNQLLISERLAEKLEVKLRSKVVLTFQDLNGEITAGAFRIVGLYNMGNKPFDEAFLFVKRSDLNRLLIGNGPDAAMKPDVAEVAHEIAIMLNDPALATEVNENLKTSMIGSKSETYREIAPELQLYEGQLKNMSLIYLTIIMLALIFGIINTMLMAVLERLRELGMLMAIGMNKLKIFSMIMMEALLLGLVGAPAGLLLGYLTVLYLGKKGLDLTAYSEAMEGYGMSSIIYFELDPVTYLQVPVAILITTFLASIYPALKAIRLNPMEAMRKI